MYAALLAILISAVHRMNRKIALEKFEPVTLVETLLCSGLTFQWVTPLLVLGSSRPLEDSDVWKLDPEDTSQVVYQR